LSVSVAKSHHALMRRELPSCR